MGPSAHWALTRTSAADGGAGAEAGCQSGAPQGHTAATRSCDAILGQHFQKSPRDNLMHRGTQRIST